MLCKDQLKACLRLLVGFIFVCCFHYTHGKQEILTLPVFYMRVYYTPGDTTGIPPGFEEKYQAVTPEHVRLNKKWTIEETYSKTLKEIETIVPAVKNSDFKMFTLNLSSNWLYDVSPNATNSTLLAEMREAPSSKSRQIPYSEIQKELLRVVSVKFLVDLNQVAANRQVTAEDLWSTYEANNWETVVHSIVRESVDAHVQLLQLVSNESLAQLARMTMTDMYNASLSEFESKFIPLQSRKMLLNNKTSNLISSFNLSVQSDGITVGNLAYIIASFTPQDLGLLYQLNTEQVRTIDRTTFAQISHMCPGYTVTDLLDRAPINVSWIIAGTKHEASRCPILLVIKGKSIKTLKHLTLINVAEMSVLEILAVSSALPWRKVFRAVSSAETEWEIIDSVKIAELASLSSIKENLIMDDSVSNAIDLIYTLNNNGSLNSTIETQRVKVRNSLEKLLNISTSAVATYTSTSEVYFQKATSSQLVTKFIQGTVAHFEIKVEDINNTLQLTSEQLYNLPRHELQQIVPPIIDAVVKLHAGKLRMSVVNMYTFLGISANSSTIEQVNVLIATKIKSLVVILNKFENVTIRTWLTGSATNDSVYNEMTVLNVILNATGFNEEDFSRIYDLNKGQMTVMRKMAIVKLMSYCTMSSVATKSLIPFNLTAFVVGIQTIKPSCTATAFYVSFQVQTISASKGEITVLTNKTASLVELVEKATGLPWRMSAPLLGLHLSDWTVLGAVTLSNIPQKTVEEVENMTFNQLADHSLELYSSGRLHSILQLFNITTKTKMYHLFNINDDDEILAVLQVTQDQITKSSLTGLFQFVLDLFSKKFDVSLHTVANDIGVKASDLYYLAPTEWHKVLSSLEDQIVKNAQIKLDVDLRTFLLLVKETNLSSKTLTQLESIWDVYVLRLWKSKTDTENKTISRILQEHGQTFPTSKTVMGFVNDNLNVTASEFSLLFDFDLEAIAVLENYTLTEIPSSCGRTQSEMLSESPLNLTKAMIGYGDIITCRPVALVTALRTVSIERLASNFSIVISDTSSILEFWTNEVTVSWTKLLWGFNLSLDEWPLISAVSLQNFSSLVGSSLSDIKSNMTYAQIATKIRSRNIDSYVNAYRETLLSRAHEMFTITSKEICSGVSSPCTTKVIDIFRNSLAILSSNINFDPSSLTAKLGVTSYEFQILVPFQWHKTVPCIISESYRNFSLSLNLTGDRLSVLLELSTKVVLNMSLDAYVPIVLKLLKPLVQTKTEMEAMTLAELAKARGIDVESLQNKTGIEIILAMFNTSLSNISFIFDWNSQFIAGLENYTLFQSSRIINDNDLSKDRSFAKLLSLMATVVPNYTPPPLTCTSGYELNKEKSKCIDKDDCSGAANPCDRETQTCQNYMGGHGCDCKKPGTFNTLGKCQAGVVLLLNCRYLMKKFTDDLVNQASEEFYQEKIEAENSVDKIFTKSENVGHFYFGCKLRKFMRGSVIFEMFLYFNSDLDVKLSDLKKEFVDGLNNTAGQENYYLGANLVDQKTATVTDFDECSQHQDDCHEHAECVNTMGSFSCKCSSGFDDLSGDGRDCKASFLKTMWWIIIIIAFVIVVLIITIIVLILRKPKSNSHYGLREPAKTPSQLSLVNGGVERERRLSKASEISYRVGDVYYRDKDGKVVRGESGKPDEIGVDNLVLTTFQPDPNMRALSNNSELATGPTNNSKPYRLENGTLTKDQIVKYKLPKYLLRSDHPIDSLEDEELGDTDVAYWTIREHDPKF